jgi:hypothetical protein
MSQFVEDCRREWKRLRVPGTIADEMANDLAADLEEAEADGASAEDVLGSGAADARAFATAWATERGLVRPRGRGRVRLRWLLAAALGFVVVLAAIVAAGVILASSGRSSGPRSMVTQVEPRFAFGPIVGTSIGGASLEPPRIWLHPVQKTVLHRRPTTFSIFVLNSGRTPITSATLVVRVGTRSYTRRTPSIEPGKLASVQIALPTDLPRDFTISARTRPIGGENNLANNTHTWHVSIRT